MKQPREDARSRKKLTLYRMMMVKEASGSNASCGSTLVLKALETI